MKYQNNFPKRLKICFFNSDFPPRVGGISTFNWSLAYHMSLSEEIEQIQVISFKNPKPGREDYSQKLSIIRLPRLSIFKTALGIKKYLKRFKDYDIFQATNMFPVGFLLVLLGRFIFRKTVFVTFHGTDAVSTQGSWKTKLAKYFTLRCASKAVAVSFSTQKEAAKYYRINPSKFSVIYYPLADKLINSQEKEKQREKIRKKYHLSDNDFIILTVAHLVKRKGVADLIKAVSLTNQPEIKLIVVGQGPEKENLEKLAKKLAVEDRVIFAGLVDSTNPFYATADLFALTSFFVKEEGDIEGLGIVLLEAQQYGLPVVGSQSGGIPEAIEEGKTGFVVPEKNPQSIKEKILILANNKDLYQKMSQRAPLFVREKFGWNKSINDHLFLYQSF